MMGCKVNWRDRDEGMNPKHKKVDFILVGLGVWHNMEVINILFEVLLICSCNVSYFMSQFH